jgi:hypothetical protein
MNLAVIAAFTAAGLSLINVALSARLASRSTRHQWRREQEQPIVANILTLSSDAINEWQETGKGKTVWREAGKPTEPDDDGYNLWTGYREHWTKGNELFKALRYEAAKLDLLASRGVRLAATRIISAHDSARYRMRPNGPHEAFGYRAFRELEKFHERLVQQTRADFGIEGLPTRYWHGFVSRGIRAGKRSLLKARFATRRLRRSITSH